MLSSLAKAMARSTRITGYRGAGRLFRPMSAIAPLRRIDGTAPLGATACIRFPAFDPYWAPYLWTSKPYEPDVEAIFRAFSPIPGKLLVDCGANIGFWTVKLSDPAYGFESFIAVEANPYVFRYLKENVEANRIPAVLHHAAIAEKAGETVRIDCTHGHAVGTVGERGTPIQTVSLQSILRSAAPAPGKRRLAIIKLDVEGSEIAAIKGAIEVDDVDIVFIYEDWPRSGLPVSRFLLDQAYSIAGVHSDGRTESLNTLQQVFDFNGRSSKGYHPSNLVAAKSPQLCAPWL